MPSIFDRSLVPGFRDLLIDQAHVPGWWRDVLDDRQLVVSLRGRYLNVYWRGQSIFKIEPGAHGLRATTHPKYLIDPGLSTQIAFDGTRFAVDGLRHHAFLEDYRPGIGRGSSLDRMKRAAGRYSGLEKTGCHHATLANPSVVDVEIALPGTAMKGDAGEEVETPRIDMAALEPDGADIRLVFWEAKAFKNPELGSAASSRPDRGAAVLGQIAAYRRMLTDSRDVIEQSYARLCGDLAAIFDAGGRDVPDLVRRVADGRSALTLGEVPAVRLIVFGFDAGQRDAATWVRHRASLDDLLRAEGGCLYAVGDAKNANLLGRTAR